MTRMFLFTLSAFALLDAHRLLAQSSVTARIAGSADALRPTASAAESRQVYSAALSLDQGFRDGRAQVYYDLDAGRYATPGDWSYSTHLLGGSARLRGSDSSAMRLFATGTLALRRNGDAWSSANYAGMGLGLNAEWLPSATQSLRVGYRADVRRFSALTALSQVDHRTFASWRLNLPSRTTVSVEGTAGAKSYDGAIATGAADTVVTVNEAARQGRGFGAGNAMPPQYVTIVSASTRRAHDLAGLGTAMLRVAQSLTDRTGVHVEGTWRQTVGAVTPLLVVTPAGFIDDGIYDDPYASNAQYVESGVTHEFGNGGTIAATSWWADKRFTSAPALDAAGAPLAPDTFRRDRLSRTTLALSLPLFAGRTGAYALATDITLSQLRHRSNDALYDYSLRAVTVGLSFSF